MTALCLLSSSEKRHANIDAVCRCWMLLLLLLLPMQARGVWQAWSWSPVAGQLLSLQVRSTTATAALYSTVLYEC